MSLQELDSTAIVEAETRHQVVQAKARGSTISWFREHHPQFFTQKVEANRAAKLPEPKSHKKKTWELVGKKVGEKQKTHIALHKDLKENTFYFKFQDNDTLRMPIDREILIVAIAAVKGSEWVQLKSGGNTLCLHRADLRLAFKKLEALKP